MMRKYIIFFALLVMMAGSAFTQIPRYEMPRRTLVRVGYLYKSWHFGNVESFSNYAQTSLPLSIHYRYGRRLSFNLGGSLYKSALRREESDSFTDVSDVMLRVSYILGDNAAILTFGTGIPTGRSRLKSDELIHAGLAANRPLGYPITLFGSGWGLMGSIAHVREIGSWIIGAGLGFYFRDKYRINDRDEIDPGEELNISFGVDRSFFIGLRRIKLTTTLIYSNYTEDRLGGEPFYEAGDKIVAQGGLLMPLGPFDPMVIFAQSRIRLDNKLTNAELIDNGNEFEFGTRLYQRIANGLKFKYQLITRIYGNTAAGASGARIVEVGLGSVLKISADRSIDPTFAILLGELDAGSGERVGLVGVTISGGITFGY